MLRNTKSLAAVKRSLFIGFKTKSTPKKIFGVVENRPNYGVIHYNLDVVISVGYRVSSKVATKFRQ